MKQVVSFDKLKLTNHQLDDNGHVSTGNNGYSGDRYSGNDGYSGLNPPDDAILFTVSGITAIADKILEVLIKNRDFDTIFLLRLKIFHSVVDGGHSSLATNSTFFQVSFLKNIRQINDPSLGKHNSFTFLSRLN